MPYKHPPHLKALLTQAAAARKEQRTYQAPILAARRSLAAAVARLKTNLAKAHAAKQKMRGDIFGPRTEAMAAWIHGQTWRDVAERIKRYTAELASATTDLATYDALHHIESEP